MKNIVSVVLALMLAVPVLSYSQDASGTDSGRKEIKKEAAELKDAPASKKDEIKAKKQNHNDKRKAKKTHKKKKHSAKKVKSKKKNTVRKEHKKGHKEEGVKDTEKIKEDAPVR